MIIFLKTRVLRVVTRTREEISLITEETKALIRDQYPSLRQAGGGGDTGPVAVTPRMLQALVRLSEASARIQLSEVITVEDAQRATQIHQNFLESIGIDPEKRKFDADVIETGTSKSQRDRIRNLKGIISDLEDQHDDRLVHFYDHTGYESSLRLNVICLAIQLPSASRDWSVTEVRR